MLDRIRGRIDEEQIAMTLQPLRPDLQKVVDDIEGLRALAKVTGFMTFKTQREILARLSPADAAAVGRALAAAEKRQQPIYQR